MYNGPGMRIFPGPESENVPTDIARTATVTELVSALDEWPASTLGVVALPSSGSGGSPDATTSPDAPNPN